MFYKLTTLFTSFPVSQALNTNTAQTRTRPITLTKGQAESIAPHTTPGVFPYNTYFLFQGRY